MDTQTENKDWSKIPWEPMHSDYPLTLEQAFQNAWKAFVVEKRPPSYGDSKCVYSKEINGCGCAIGVSLLSDSSLTKPFFNGLTFFTLMGRKETRPEIDRLFIDPSNNGYRELQSIHDRAAIVNYLEKIDFSRFHNMIETDLREMAEKYNLAIPA